MFSASRRIGQQQQRFFRTLDRTIDTEKVGKTFPPISPKALRDPEFLKNPSLVMNRKPKVPKKSLLPRVLPNSYEELEAQLASLQEQRKLEGTKEFSEEEWKKMEQKVKFHLDYSLFFRRPLSTADQEGMDVQRSEREMFQFMQEQCLTRFWDELADIQVDELRELKRLHLRLEALKKESPQKWLGIADLKGKDDEVAVSALLESLKNGDMNWKEADDSTLVPTDKKRLTGRLALEDVWSASSRASTVSSIVLQSRMESWLDDFAQFQLSLTSKRRMPKAKFFWLERISESGFAQLNQMYDDYFNAALGSDTKEEDALLSIFKALEAAKMVSFTNRVRDSALKAPGTVAGSTNPACLGKYLTIGYFIFDREVPRSFERMEWSPRMLRFRSLNVQDYPVELQSEMHQRIEQWKRMRHATLHSNRWTQKYAVPELVQYHNRQIMVRPQAVSLCNELNMASLNRTGLAKLLVGPRGLGKSATLLHCVSWARANGWLTMYLPRANDLVSDRGAFASGTEYLGTNVLPADSTCNPTWHGQPKGALEILETMQASHFYELSTLEQQRTYSHKLYESPKEGSKRTLAHILMRGIMTLSKAPDALYDLRMELNLVTKFPVLIAVDEFNALYWPTAVYSEGLPVPAHKLTVCKTFRFINHVPGDIEDDDNHRTIRKAKVNAEHIPRRGAVIGATTRSLESEVHDTQIPPCRFEEFETEGVDYIHMNKYSKEEVETACMWYTERNCFEKGEVTNEMLGKIRAVSAGYPDRVARFAQTRKTYYFKHL